MTVLETNKRIFELLCVYHTSNFKIKLISCLLSAFILTFESLAMISSILFVAVFVKNDWENSLYALFQSFALGSVIYTLISAYVVRDGIIAVFEKFQQISYASKTQRSINTISFQIYSMKLWFMFQQTNQVTGYRHFS